MRFGQTVMLAMLDGANRLLPAAGVGGSAMAGFEIGVRRAWASRIKRFGIEFIFSKSDCAGAHEREDLDRAAAEIIGYNKPDRPGPERDGLSVISGQAAFSGLLR